MCGQLDSFAELHSNMHLTDVSLSLLRVISPAGSRWETFEMFQSELLRKKKDNAQLDESLVGE